MKIALITKLKNKDYEFVEYTKSYNEFDNLLSNSDELKRMYKEVYDHVGLVPNDKNLTLQDFNLHLIASFMDDTEEKDRMIANKWELPIYFVTKETNCELKDCEEKSCAECLSCYKFPMEKVTTRLR